MGNLGRLKVKPPTVYDTLEEFLNEGHAALDRADEPGPVFTREPFGSPPPLYTRPNRMAGSFPDAVAGALDREPVALTAIKFGVVAVALAGAVGLSVGIRVGLFAFDALEAGYNALKGGA